MNEDFTTIDLLRHGEPEGGRKFRGSLDDPLSSQGWAQMWAAVGKHHPWEVIISSPLIRCARFARELGERYDLPVEIATGLQEIGFGDWEGRTPAEIHAATPEALGRFWIDPLNNPPPGGEPLADFQRRVIAAWTGLLERHAGRHLLIVGHGGMIRMVLCHVLEMPLTRMWRLEIPYATLSRLRAYGRGIAAEPFMVFHAGRLE